MAKVGLVTVLYNSDDVLEGFFKSLSLQSFSDYKLYIIDNSHNAKSDQLIGEFLEKYPVAEYQHIKSDGNIGVAAGNNVGIKASLAEGSEYVLLLNNDIEFGDPYLIQDMVGCAESRNEHLIIPKILFYDSRKLWMAGGKISYLKGITYHVGEGEEDGPQYNKEAYFDYAPTCFMLISKLVFESIGLMDEKYFVYYDDTDFVYRAGQKGYKVLLLPQYTVLHKVSSLTGGGTSNFSIYYNNRNRIYFIRKNFSILTKCLALSYCLLGRVVKYCRYNKEQKTQLLKSLNSGFKM